MSHYLRRMSVILQLISGSALPAPVTPSSDTIGTYELWFLSCTLHANPEGDNDVGEIISDTSMYVIREHRLCDEPVGELKIPPGTTTTSFLIILNWHGSL